MSTSQNYRDLIAWQRAMDLVVLIYQVTGTWPSCELYGLTSQVRRAAVSVASNIAEGQGRRTPKDFVRYLNIAHGSLREIETQLLIAERLGYLSQTGSNPCMMAAAETGRLIAGLIKSIPA